MADSKQAEIVKTFPTMVVPLNKIRVDDKFNVRQSEGLDKASLEELAQSIKENGLIHPLLVRPTKQGYDLVSGFRRMKAIQLLKDRDTIECKVCPEDLSEAEAMMLNYVENVHRKDLHNYEKARRLAELDSKFKIKPEEMSRRLGFELSRSTVVNMIRCFNQLTPKLKEMWANPNSPNRGYFNWPNLIQIIKHKDPGAQYEEFLRIQGLYKEQGIETGEFDASDRSGKGKKGKKVKGKKGPRMLRLPTVDAAIRALMDGKHSLSDNIVGDCMAVFDFVTGRKKELRIREIVVFNEKVAKEAEKAAKVAEKEAKAEKKAKKAA